MQCDPRLEEFLSLETGCQSVVFRRQVSQEPADLHTNVLVSLLAYNARQYKDLSLYGPVMVVVIQINLAVVAGEGVEKQFLVKRKHTGLL